MKNPVAAPGLYATFAALCAVALILLVLLLRSSAGMQPVRGLPPFSLDEAPADPPPDPGSPRTLP